ncbi:hypothetical protein [Lacticaseibacillus daqingensis]|uniref:hypothetical protein n=1 Tax=Lacticaseibacillus daqingensis TaxID=2486014 RepID=UPI000F79FB86|nr:hypothetical protein [Lacticaseibacillus daqingensis]
MRKGVLLAEHLAALSVMTLVVVWLVIVARVYTQQISPLARQVAVATAAQVAVRRLTPGVPGHEAVWVGRERYVVAVTAAGIEVWDDQQQQVWQISAP